MSMTELHHSGDDTLNYSWHDVAKAFWQRYPNPHAGHVLSEDVISRRVEGCKLITTRILTKTNSAPRWSQSLFRDKTVFIMEESVVDPVAQTIVTKTRNISLTYWSQIMEKCTYVPSSENKNWTLLKREAVFSSQVRFLSGRLASFCRYRYKNNIRKSKLGWNFVLRALYGSGV